jgi:hypothetical protein
MNDLLAMLLSWVPVQRDETRHVRKGSDSDKSAFLDHFRFASMNGHHQARTPCRKSANCGSRATVP